MNIHIIFLSKLYQKNRFKFLLKFTQFDDKETRAGKREGNKYAAIREFFEKVNVQNGKHPWSINIP